MSYFNAGGQLPLFNYILIAVSKTSDPRDGFLGPYFVQDNGLNPNTGKVRCFNAKCSVD